MASDTGVNNEARIEELDRDLAALSIMGHWRGVPRVRPQQENRAEHWKWQPIITNLMRSGELIKMEDTGRRTLQLVTPGIGQTSPNIQMSVQLVNPGEVAEAHRHSFAATRFIVSGSGAYTTVNGEALWLSAGDYVTTPGWCWHDHANPSPEPIVWLDIHDNPFVGGKLGVRFGEGYEKPTQDIVVREGTAKDNMSAVRRINKLAHPAHQAAAYPWTEVRPALERAASDDAGDPCDGIMLDYTNPVNNSHLLPTMGARIQMLRRNERTQPHRHTSYTIYHVVEGEGVSVVGDKRFEWSKGDCFTVPNWEWHTHEQHGAEPAILFSVHDQPILEAFDLYREEREEA